jgi:hypothetical protein
MESETVAIVKAVKHLLKFQIGVLEACLPILTNAGSPTATLAANQINRVKRVYDSMLDLVQDRGESYYFDPDEE